MEATDGPKLPQCRLLGSDRTDLRICSSTSGGMAKVIRTDYNESNRYYLGTGHGSLKLALSQYMLNSGLIIPPKDIIITSGAIQALLIVLRTLTRPGDTVAVESPGYFGFYTMLDFLNLCAIEIPSNPQKGFSVSTLEKIIKNKTKISCILLSTNFSNPTGAIMPDNEKRKLVELCLKNDLAIIEDDIYGDIAFNHIRPKPLKIFSQKQVIYINSMSKILAPGYRLGWISGGKYQYDIEKCYNMGIFTVNSSPEEYAPIHGVRK